MAPIYLSRYFFFVSTKSLSLDPSPSVHSAETTFYFERDSDTPLSDPVSHRIDCSSRTPSDFFEQILSPSTFSLLTAIFSLSSDWPRHAERQYAPNSGLTWGDTLEYGPPTGEGITLYRKSATHSNAEGPGRSALCTTTTSSHDRPY